MIRTGTSSNPEAPRTLQYPEPPETPEKYGFRGFNASSTALPSTSHTLAIPKRKRSARVSFLSTDLCCRLTDQADDKRKPRRLWQRGTMPPRWSIARVPYSQGKDSNPSAQRSTVPSRPRAEETILGENRTN